MADHLLEQVKLRPAEEFADTISAEMGAPGGLAKAAQAAINNFAVGLFNLELRNSPDSADWLSEDRAAELSRCGQSIPF